MEGTARALLTGGAELGISGLLLLEDERRTLNVAIAVLRRAAELGDANAALAPQSSGSMKSRLGV